MRKPLSLKARAVNFLSRREHSRYELKQKLSRHVEPEDASMLDQLLDELERDNWLSDLRFAQSLVHRRANRRGVALIEHELSQQGVAAEIIHEVCQPLYETEFERCQQVWQNRFNQPPTDRNDYARHYRFLGSRGFSPECIRRVIGSF